MKPSGDDKMRNMRMKVAVHQVSDNLSAACSFIVVFGCPDLSDCDTYSRLRGRRREVEQEYRNEVELYKIREKEETNDKGDQMDSKEYTSRGVQYNTTQYSTRINSTHNRLLISQNLSCTPFPFRMRFQSMLGCISYVYPLLHVCMSGGRSVGWQTKGRSRKISSDLLL